jgi:hypothetical protein
MRRKRDINSKGPHDTAPRKTPSAVSGRQIMNWFELISEEDVELLMEHVDRFHNWYVAGFSYDPLDMSAEVLYAATPMGLL